MIAGRPTDLLRQLEAPTAHDSELLARFVRERDQLAFAELLRRHGPVVLGVCRRMTGHQQDAEDAFQAVFLILSRKAAAIGKPELIGNWLYGVAVRVARKARRSALRRRTREVAVSSVPDRAMQSQSLFSELIPILDEELATLPSWYREAIVLCDLRGLSREEAAVALAVPEGTVSSRLANGRKKLAERLTRRGIALASAAAGIPNAQASVSAELESKTCGLLADWMGGRFIPKQVARLTEGGLTMRKTFMMGLFSIVLVVSGVVYATNAADNPLPAGPPQEPVAAGKAVVVEQPVLDDKPGKKPIAFTSAPRLRDTVDINMHTIREVSWNKQGDRIAIVGQRLFSPPAPKANQPNRANVPEATEVGCVFVFAISTLNTPKITNYASLYLNSFQQDAFAGFSPDGKQVLTEHREYQLLSGMHKLHFWGDDGEEFGTPVRPTFNPTRRSLAMNARLTEKNSIDLDTASTQGYYFASDGKTFRTIRLDQKTVAVKDITTLLLQKINVLEIDAAPDNRIKTLLTVEGGIYAMSSDGKRLAVLSLENNTVTVYDVDRGTKMFSYKVPSEVKKSDAPASTGLLDLGVPNFGGANLGGRNEQSSAFSSPWMTFSPDGRRLFVSCGIGVCVHFQRRTAQGIQSQSEYAIISGGVGQSVVLNADTGDPLPALEGAECLYCTAGKNAFSGDGRLIVLSGTNYAVSKQKLTLVSRKTGNNPKNLEKPDGEQIVMESGKSFLTVWDTQTGKVVKSWERNPTVAFNPARPILAVIEPNEGDTRLGLWDFSAEAAEKK
jgi:RNA polymerase sigma factor (sigma-70 family)